MKLNYWIKLRFYFIICYLPVKSYLKRVIICWIHYIEINKNKICAQEIRQVKVPQLALPPTGPRPRLKSPNCRYTKIDHFESYHFEKGSLLNRSLRKFTTLIPFSFVEKAGFRSDSVFRSDRYPLNNYHVIKQISRRFLSFRKLYIFLKKFYFRFRH